MAQSTNVEARGTRVGDDEGGHRGDEGGERPAVAQEAEEAGEGAVEGHEEEDGGDGARHVELVRVSLG